MQHAVFTDTVQSTYKVALLIKKAAFTYPALKQHYINPLVSEGVHEESIIAYSLDYNENNKAPVKLIKESLQSILKACSFQKVEVLFVADGSYFKTLTKEGKSEPHYGYIKQCKIEGFEHIKVILTVNYQALFYNPDIGSRLMLSLKTLADHLAGTFKQMGTGIIHSAEYPETLSDIADGLAKLHKHPRITCDIEGYGLSLDTCGVASIAFAWNKHEGLAFTVQPKQIHWNPYTSIKHIKQVSKLVKDFLSSYQGSVIYHNASFDIKHLIFTLYMESRYSDYTEAIKGLMELYRSVHDTKLLVYLATNNAQNNNLKLKHNAFEFAGNYAQEDDDIKDITRIPTAELLQYNLVDALATRYVFDKFYPKVIQDDQLDIYNKIFIPSLKVITNMELVGLPLDLDMVKKGRDKLTAILDEKREYLKNLDVIKQWEWRRKLENYKTATAKLKTKVNSIDKYAEEFNPGSGKHVQELIYDIIGLAVVDKTPTGLPATGADTLEKLSNQLIAKFNLTEEDLK